MCNSVWQETLHNWAVVSWEDVAKSSEEEQSEDEGTEKGSLAARWEEQKEAAKGNY